MMAETKTTTLMDSFSSKRTMQSSGVPFRHSKKNHSANLAWLGSTIDIRDTERVSKMEVEFVISPIFPKGRAALITGVGGSSKSMLLKEMAIAVATGRDILGMTVPNAGKVVLILAEDTPEDSHRSIYAIFKSLNLTDQEIALLHDRLYIFAAAGKDCVLMSEDDGESGNRIDQLIEFVSQLEDVRLIGLDPAIAMTRGRELDEIAQREFAENLDRLAIETKTAVLVISHAAKSVQNQQEISSHANRGSGAFTDAFRLEVLMRVMTTKESKSFRIPENNRHQYVRLQVTKANSLPPALMHPKWLERVEGGALTLATLTPAAPASGERARKGLELFFEADQESGELGSVSLSYPAWKAKALNEGLLTGLTSSARDMAARRLFTTIKDSKWICEDGEHWKVTTEGEQEILE
ncbi:MAG: hypothetical protein RLY14_1970 [Planctomycetota bacterium]|jgi:ABC-type thiamine transport system ATPase subunit